MKANSVCCQTQLFHLYTTCDQNKSLEENNKIHFQWRNHFSLSELLFIASVDPSHFNTFIFQGMAKKR